MAPSFPANAASTTAFVLSHKLREAMAAETIGHSLAGEVEVDGAYFGGHIRPANFAENRADRRKAEFQTGTRRVVIAARQRKGRTLTAVFRSEADGLAFIQTVTAKGAAIHADEAIHWDVLHDTFPVSRINHSEAYCKDGACTNQAESYFSRLRRMVQGQHQFVSPGHLHHSVCTRTASNGTIGEHFPATSKAVLHRPASNVNFTYKTLSKNMVSVCSFGPSVTDSSITNLYASDGFVFYKRL